MRAIITLLIATALMSCNQNKKEEINTELDFDTPVIAEQVPKLELYASEGKWVDAGNMNLYVGLPKLAEDDEYKITDAYNVSDDSQQRIVLLFQNKIGKLPDNNGHAVEFKLSVDEIVQIGSAPTLDKEQEVEVLLYHDNNVAPAVMKQYANQFFAATDCATVIPTKANEPHNLGQPKKCGRGVIKP